MWAWNFVTFRRKHRMRVFECRVLRRMFRSKRADLTGVWRNLRSEKLRNIYSPSGILMVLWQIWLYLRYERCYSTAGYGFRRFLRNDFPFRIHRTEKYKSIATQCLQAERILPWKRILLTVKFPEQPNCCEGRYNRERCSVSGPGDLLKGVELDSQQVSH
jgi:hypothetical protein